MAPDLRDRLYIPIKILFAHNIFVLNLRNMSLGRRILRWQDNIKMDPGEIRFEDVDETWLARYTLLRLRVFV
jgi:hypothetical protein